MRSTIVFVDGARLDVPVSPTAVVELLNGPARFMKLGTDAGRELYVNSDSVAYVEGYDTDA